jgi:hypothetical protein
VDITALGISLLGFALMYGGVLMARQVDNSGSASVFRIGGIFMGFMLVPLLHSALGSELASATLSGRYLFAMVIIGALVDYFVVKPRA